jgi:galactose mutarotase-like enzyme
MYEKFETSDANLAAAIVATVGAPLVSLDRSDPGNILLGFNRDDVTDELVESYWNGQLRVEPQVFAAAQRYIARETHGGFTGE